MLVRFRKLKRGKADEVVGRYTDMSDDESRTTMVYDSLTAERKEIDYRSHVDASIPR